MTRLLISLVLAIGLLVSPAWALPTDLPIVWEDGGDGSDGDCGDDGDDGGESGDGGDF